MTPMADALNGRWLPGWLLDEVAGAGRENLDVRHVARYDTKEHADADEELLPKGLGLHQQSAVVDLGAGTGQSPSRRPQHAPVWSPSTCRR